MSLAFWLALALFVVMDVAIIAVVFRRVKSSPFALFLPGGGQQRVLKTADAMVSDYLRVNYSGDPQQLPAALTGLLPQLRDLLRANGVEPQPEVLRALVEVSAARHRIATPRQLREALTTIG